MASRARELERGRDKRQHKIHADFVRRHPERARQERALRKHQAAVQRDFAHKVHGTPETHAHAAQVQQGALARLFMSGAIDSDQLAWSQEIRIAHERIARDAGIGTVSLETRVDQSRSSDGTFFEKLGAVRAEVAYSRWRACLPAAGPVLAMIVGDEPCTAVAKRFRKDPRTLRKMLTSALDAWPEFCSEARDRVDEATLLAAQAAIL